MHTLDNCRNSHTGKDRKFSNANFTHWKMHTLEKERMEFAHPGKLQNGKCSLW